MTPQRASVVSYSQAHLRLKVDRFRPSQYACIACGDPAREWAYMGGDVDELTEHGTKYSLDQDRYEPMCTACHRRHDRALADGRSVDVCPKGHLWVENTGIRVKRTLATGLRFCRACHREYGRPYREANREALAAQRRMYYEANHEVIEARRRVYNEANREALAERRHRRRAARKAAALGLAVA